MSLDGFIAGPGDEMDWIFDFVPGGTQARFPEVMAATGAVLIGRRTGEVGERMAADPPTDEPYDAGPLFVLTHEPPEEADSVLGDGIRFFSSPGMARIDLEPIDTTRSGNISILRFRVLK